MEEEEISDRQLRLSKFKGIANYAKVCNWKILSEDCESYDAAYLTQSGGLVVVERSEEGILVSNDYHSIEMEKEY